MLQERNLTPREIELKEKILKGLKLKKNIFVKQYGKDAEQVMMGIALKNARKQIEKEQKQKLKEIVINALKK